MIQKFNKQPIEPDQPDLPNLPNLPNLHDQPDQRHQNELHLIGFGSQGRSWAQNLRDSGWSVRIYLSATSIQAASPSWVDAQNLGFEVRSTHELALLSSRSESHLIAFACPDHHIAGIYQDQLSQLNIPLSLILLHGFAVYSGELKLLNDRHKVELFAPKAIGPQIRKIFKKGQTHDLVAAVTTKAPFILALAQGLGFSPENLVVTQPEVEAIGDLISEQGLLCGGIFTLMDWTITAMRNAGTPGPLIAEECITELLLIAGLIKERGLEATLGAISKAALAGTATMNQAFEESGFKSMFLDKVSRVVDRKFVNDFNRGQWQTQAEALALRFQEHDRFLGLKKQNSNSSNTQINKGYDK